MEKNIFSEKFDIEKIFDDIKKVIEKKIQISSTSIETINIGNGKRVEATCTFELKVGNLTAKIDDAYWSKNYKVVTIKYEHLSTRIAENVSTLSDENHLNSFLELIQKIMEFEIKYP